MFYAVFPNLPTNEFTHTLSMKDMSKYAHILDQFKELKSYERLELFCGMLHVCHPLELRFLGTCVEELGRKDYLYLREYEAKANSYEHLQTIDALTTLRAKYKLNSYLSLLQSTNTICAKLLFDKILEWSSNLHHGGKLFNCGDDDLESSFLMLTMAVYHPAFSFSQRMTLWDIYEALKHIVTVPVEGEEEEEKCLADGSAGDYVCDRDGVLRDTMDHKTCCESMMEVTVDDMDNHVVSLDVPEFACLSISCGEDNTTVQAKEQAPNGYIDVTKKLSSPSSNESISPMSSPIRLTSHNNSLSEWLKKQRLHKYHDHLEKLTPEELLNTTEQEFVVHYKLTKGAAQRLFHALRDNSRTVIGQAPKKNGHVTPGVNQHNAKWKNDGPHLQPAPDKETTASRSQMYITSANGGPHSGKLVLQPLPGTAFLPGEVYHGTAFCDVRHPPRALLPSPRPEVGVSSSSASSRTPSVVPGTAMVAPPGDSEQLTYWQHSSAAPVSQTFIFRTPQQVAHHRSQAPYRTHSTYAHTNLAYPRNKLYYPAVRPLYEPHLTPHSRHAEPGHRVDPHDLCTCSCDNAPIPRLVTMATALERIQRAALASAGGREEAQCYNCGRGHSGNACSLPTMETITQPSSYHLQYNLPHLGSELP